MANDIPSPTSASTEKFREAVRVHKCEALHCPYCLIRNWVNEIEEKLNQITAVTKKTEKMNSKIQGHLETLWDKETQN